MQAVLYDCYGGGPAGLKSSTPIYSHLFCYFYLLLSICCTSHAFLQHVEVPVPIPSKGEVLVKLEAASINPVDWKIQKGMLRPFLPRKFPFIPVSDVAGEVSEVGPGVENFKAGDKVVAMLNSLSGGGLAEYAVAKQSLTVPRPPEVSAAEGAALCIAGLTAHQALTQSAGLKLDGTDPRKNILITAASGGVGHYAVQLAKLGNAHVTATCGGRNVDLVKSLGADEVLDYKTPEGAALKSPSGQKYDTVIHCASSTPWSTFEPNLSANGKVIDITPGPGTLATYALKKLTFSKKQMVPLLLVPKGENLDFLVKLTKEGKLKTVIDSKYPLSEAEDAKFCAPVSEYGGEAYARCSVQSLWRWFCCSGEAWFLYVVFGESFMICVHSSGKKLFVSSGKTEISHVEVPVPTPSKDELLLKLEAASINPLDWRLQKGKARPILPRKFPFIPGTDVAGEVLEVGTGVGNFKAGDKVVAMLSVMGGGGLAEYAVVKQSLTILRPAEVSAAEGAALGIAGLTAHQALTQAARVKLDGSGPLKNILITAASGGVGHYAVQLAKLGNTHVTATCGARNVDLVKSLGADEVLDYKTPDGAALKSPSGQKYDAVIHCATYIPWSTFEPNLSAKGKVIDLTPLPSTFCNYAMQKLTFSKKQIEPLLMVPKGENLDFLVKLVKEGKLKTVIDSKHPLSKAEDAWAKSMDGHATGKIIVEP
ncbi:hypothetical protein RJ639_006423 [Escallonia herrerae]|uniref:Enoyl reductase (ER) domain-containing protein n=1 Tax=Escallonia herrerae TaxID=1293975 RepID=A0AA89AWW9_9ASTE|nr:hypothetical protein RJ639_006423 [Escallonia herrerae]